ncbi:hypothetical protein H0H93_003890, partial [Arthromyces matolae]
TSFMILIESFMLGDEFNWQMFESGFNPLTTFPIFLPISLAANATATFLIAVKF